jgi:hypothetical protein
MPLINCSTSELSLRTSDCMDALAGLVLRLGSCATIPGESERDQRTWLKKSPRSSRQAMHGKLEDRHPRLRGDIRNPKNGD